MSDHTKEPWQVGSTREGEDIVIRGYEDGDPEKEIVLMISHGFKKPDGVQATYEDFLRIVSCVNACKGIPTEALVELRGRGEEGRLAGLRALADDACNELYRLSEGPERKIPITLTDWVKEALLPGHHPSPDRLFNFLQEKGFGAVEIHSTLWSMIQEGSLVVDSDQGVYLIEKEQ